MHPGQRYSFVFETDASPSYWNPAEPSLSKIKVTAHAIRYTGADEMVSVTTKGFIQAQLEFATGSAMTAMLPVEVVAKPAPKPKPKPETPTEQEDEDSKKVIKVKVRKKAVVTPIPVKTTDAAWATLGWPHDPQRVGFSIRPLQGRVRLFYNAEFPPFLDLRNRMSKKSLETEFVRRYELKLVLHTI